jgi:hypothetical protein
MKVLNTVSFHAVVLLMTAILISTAARGEITKATSLFNGKDFTGWEVPEGNIWWTIADGVLTTKNGPEKKASVLWTTKQYEDFVIELEFRFGEGTIDSGVFLRSINEQIQIGISASLHRDMTCSPYIGSKGKYPVEAEGVKELLKQDDWNKLKIQTLGNVYTVWLNGKQVLQYTSDTAIEEGPIGLQLHAGKIMAIDFRNITLMELKGEAKAGK